MIKKIFLALVLLAVVLAAGVYFFGSSLLNSAIEFAVPKFGSVVTQTPVTLEEADISVLSGNGALTGLNVGNPKGYQAEHIFALGRIEVDIEPMSLLKDTIVINRIYIAAPKISYERGVMNSNLDSLLDNIESATGGAKPVEPAPEAEPATEEPAGDDTAGAKKIYIKEFVMEDGSVFVGALGTGTSLPLPRIELTNIGTENKGASIAQVTAVVMREVIRAIGPVIRDAADLLKDGGIDVINKTIEEAGKGGGNAAGAVSKGLNKLLGGDE